MKEYTRDLLLIHAAVLLFGLSGLFGRLVSMPAVLITFGRVFFAGIAMFIFLKLRGADIKLKSTGNVIALAAAGVILAFHWTAFFMSVQLANVATAVLTYSTFPLFVTFLEPLLFHEKLRISDAAAALVMLAGVSLIVPNFDFSDKMTAGAVWGMGASLSFAVLSLINRKFAGIYSGTLVSFYEQATAAVVLMPAFFLVQAQWTVRNTLLVILLGVVFTAAAHSLFISALKHVKAQTAGMISGLESVYGIISAAIFLGEIPSMKEVAGGVIILGAAMWSTLRK